MFKLFTTNMLILVILLANVFNLDDIKRANKK